MSDIFEIAKMYGGNDYYEMSTGKTYLINEWYNAKRFGLPPIVPGIRVREADGSIQSYIPDPELVDKYKDSSTVDDKPKNDYISFRTLMEKVGDTLFNKKYKTKSGLGFIVRHVNLTSNTVNVEFYDVENAERSVAKAVDVLKDGEHAIPISGFEDILGSCGWIEISIAS